MTPIESHPCKVKGKRLTFRMLGLPYAEPGFATVEDAESDPSASSTSRQAGRQAGQPGVGLVLIVQRDYRVGSPVLAAPCPLCLRCTPAGGSAMTLALTAWHGCDGAPLRLLPRPSPPRWLGFIALRSTHHVHGSRRTGRLSHHTHPQSATVPISCCPPLLPFGPAVRRGAGAPSCMAWCTCCTTPTGSACRPQRGQVPKPAAGERRRDVVQQRGGAGGAGNRR